MAANSKKENFKVQNDELTVDEANEFIGTYLQIQQVVEKQFVKEKMQILGFQADVEDKVNVFLEKQSSNAFVFSRNAIERFFNGSEKDQNGIPAIADHLLIVLGARPFTQGNNEPGSPTILAVGCIQDRNNPTKFNVLNSEFPVGEWPPTTSIVTLEKIENVNPDIQFGNVFQFIAKQDI